MKLKMVCGTEIKTGNWIFYDNVFHKVMNYSFHKNRVHVEVSDPWGMPGEIHFRQDRMILVAEEE